MNPSNRRDRAKRRDDLTTSLQDFVPSKNLNLLSLISDLTKPVTLARNVLQEVEDLRRFKPSQGAQSFARVTGQKAITKTNVFDDVHSTLQFVQPKNVVVCVRRAMRRQVLHALGYTGKPNTYRRPGAGGRGSSSNIHC